MSQEQLAEQLHLSRQAVSKWEMGQSTPDVDTCIKLCEVLNVTPNRLLLGFDEEARSIYPAKKDPLTTIFAVSSAFLMVVCVCGTIMMICNMYNGEIFEPIVHILSLNMIRGSIFVFAVMFIAILTYWCKKKRGMGSK